MMMNCDLEFDAREFTLGFASEMDAWEDEFRDAWQENNKNYIHGAPEEIMARYRAADEAMHAKYRALYCDIFYRYCTDRERKYGGPHGPKSAGMPTKYNGIDADAPCQVVQKNKNRIEVTWDIRNTILPRKTLFVLVRRDQQWRIDSYKYLSDGNEKWDNGIL
ncbi:NTF2 fold immunity protein [Corticimicrobacter populi]|uniref:NTF2 fold immunity protein domain-containing protein n=1 Tax=Corticimicrobacter populi TaxID=2175229 RepID=A0A2V1K134_9BURK|nr:NTF2 fold immunity protein [Corticimicrobacter populi]PWF24916.1 hypothetical protein DD235_01690 [Corticimicrobacter populi]